MTGDSSRLRRPDVTTEEAARCLEILESAAAPIVAADLAAELNLAGSRETRRRHVRAIIRRLRRCGAMIVATLNDGYFLTDDWQIWHDYLSGRQIDAKKVLGETHRRKKMLADAAGQGLLFDMHMCGGVATCAMA